MTGVQTCALPILKALARKVIKEAKRESWRPFCSTIGRETTLNDVWRKIKKMIGKFKPPHVCVQTCKIIVACLNYFLEYSNPLKSYQTCFWRSKYTNDALVKVCNEFEKAGY